jgi:hypothetical protein
MPLIFSVNPCANLLDLNANQDLPMFDSTSSSSARVISLTS